MDAGELELVRMIAREEAERASELARYDDMSIRSDITRLADALATVLPAASDEGAAEAAVEELAGDEAAEAVEAAEAIIEGEPDGEPIVIVDVTEDGEPLEAVTEVELTPAEAADAIAPLRTHGLLRKPFANWFR